MLSYQTTDETVNLTFSKVFWKHLNCSSCEMLRVKELTSKSHITTEDVMALDDELKENWWQKNKARFLAKIQ